ncbi:hypothetical protein J3U64_08530 [Snodgrassella sp. B3800]|uniref:hypothetical protein n=1 Tax=Snodgrassella sp. B3800 TaxID=2818039 RepID=UPI0022698B07|nr:hypothetical protein [Snodgrassella sp. B3800]MCX8747503.1 hypothetical protein [Snodgrassella sp. B3800]
MRLLNNIIKLSLSIWLGLFSVISFASVLDNDEPIIVEQIRQKLAEPVNAARISDAQVKDIIRHNLDSRLGISLYNAFGINLQSISSDNALAPIQLGFLELSYSDETAAAQAIKSLGKIRFFKHSKILVPFSEVRIGSKLQILFTENAGSRRAQAIIDKFSKYEDKNSETSG